MTGLVSDYSLVNFMPVSVKSKEMMLAVKEVIDKANGYCFTSLEEADAQRMFSFSNNQFEYDKIHEVRENFMSTHTSSSESDGGENDNKTLSKAKKTKKSKREKLGNDLDNIDIDDPGFQI